MGKYSIGLTALLLFVFTLTTYSAELGGEVGQEVISRTGNPYIVSDDLIVPEGKTLTIMEGTILLFKPFTGIIVRGELIIDGLPKSPVILTTTNDNRYNDSAGVLPNPFDWNGILISEFADGAKIKNCELSYSVYGIKSQTPKLDIVSGIFKQNGQFNAAVNDKILPAVDNVEFSWKPDPASLEVIKRADSTNTAKEQKTQKTRKILRYSSLGIGIIGTGVGTVFLAKDLKSRSIINTYEEASLSGKEPPAGSTYKDAQRAYDEFQTQENIAIGGYILGVLGLTGFTLTFFF